MKTLVIYSHSYQADSLANKAIIAELEKENDFTIRNIEALYPDGNIDVALEQQYLLDADVVVFQHPLFWFNIPSGLKRYMDDVWARGFSHGTGGDKLKGKKFIESFTTGAPEEYYPEAACNDVTASVRISAGFTQMEYCGYVATFGCNPVVNPNVEAEAKAHAARLVEKVRAL